MSSSFKKAQKASRRTHQERHQPAFRQRMGLLEKHKDYVERARDYHSKKQRIKKLQEKAAQRNPDEFYFKMINTKTKNGVHVEERNEKYSGEMTKLLNSQSQAYVTRKRQQELKTVDRLKSTLHMIGAGKAKNKHTLFLDSKEQARSFDPAEHFDTDAALVDRAYNRIRKSTLHTEHVQVATSYQKAQKAIRSSYHELAARLERADKLTEAMEELQAQKNLMGKGARKKVGEDAKGNPVFRWKKERKR